MSAAESYYPVHASLPANAIILHPHDTLIVEAVLRALKESVARTTGGAK
jgi:hypothetical protein